LELGKLGFLEVESGERGGLTLDFEEFEKPVLFLSLCFSNQTLAWCECGLFISGAECNQKLSKYIIIYRANSH